MSEPRMQSDPEQLPGSDSLSSAARAFEPAEAERRAQIELSVGQLVDSIAGLDPAGRRFARTMASLDRLGQREFGAVSALSGQVVARRLQMGRAALTEKGPLAHRLEELRRLVEEFDPARLKVGEKKSRGPFGLGPVRDDLEILSDYFDRFAHSQERVQEVLRALEEARLSLERDNGLLAQELASLGAVMESLGEQAYLLGRLDETLEARIDEIGRMDPARADSLRTDALSVVRRRRQDVLTQLAVSSQGAASLRIIEDSNESVIRAILAATSTTSAALRTAAMVAQAVAAQQMALAQVEQATKAAEAMAGQGQRVLARQAAVVRSGVVQAQARLESLREAWSGVSRALDDFDAQKDRALMELDRSE